MLVDVCREGAPELRQRALETLCHNYWYPLYAFARRTGNGRQDAEDLTQGFFQYLLERGLFSSASQELGKLRTFLLTAFQRYAGDVRERGLALKRGGGYEILSLDVDEAERNFGEPAEALTPHEIFDHQWAMTVLLGALGTLREEEDGAGRGTQFAILEPFLNPRSEAGGNYADAADALGMSGEAARKVVSRLRGKFRDILRRQIGDTLRFPTDEQVDAELTALKRALRRL
ncbi:sigma-70 family RNA polymerase sigma factor [Luteolibacter yonseiensis]|uniref:Sigma-70 family RNA polymerase sigma factor n=1 Tax=Luteolibacter yonseiensis TaxID=1144680 RepID=A0A934R2S0_9BACT|nr:sigma-70 family RNA polymerase sigma factor [Luteolibacter yonseiensis]MBK1815387.1 sigma-70 family RNA polymerase sigma factor [Luteolibacter yonseiensis]